MMERSHAFGKEKYSPLDNVIFSRRMNQVLMRLPSQPDVIADFGAGYDCRLLKALEKEYPEAQFIGVDTEFSSTIPVTERFSLITNNLNESLPIESESVDVGLSLAVLEHLDKPNVFLQEAYRVLKPGGMMLLTTPGPSSRPLLEFLAFRLHVIDEHEIRDHKHYFSTAELRAEFMKAGFPSEKIDAKTFIFGMNNIVKAIK